MLNHYAEVVDQRRWSELSEVFTEDAHVDYESTGGQKGPVGPVMEWLDRALVPWPLNLHFISNVRIEIDGDEARAHSYFHAPMGRPRGDGTQEVITNAGYYHDRLVRTPAGWRIRERVCEQTMMLGALPDGYEIPE